MNIHNTSQCIDRKFGEPVFRRRLAVCSRLHRLCQPQQQGSDILTHRELLCRAARAPYQPEEVGGERSGEWGLLVCIQLVYAGPAATKS